jgi:chromosomal replication initiator protein
MDDQTATYEETCLNPNPTFDALATGKANELACAAAREIILKPADSFNPLFIYGGVGTGKTHLIQAIGNAAYAANPNLKVRYIHAEDFFSEVAGAFAEDSRDAFKLYYRSLDLLLVDDIQVFNRKDRTQDEFLYVFNSLVETEKQIVITGDAIPTKIPGLEKRLISRFSRGLTVALKPPKLEMRIAILKKLTEVAFVGTSDAVLRYIAKHVPHNAPVLQGALHRLGIFASFYGREIDLDVAKEALRY